jgi:transcriptional regulator with XRE-family HTH domain
MADRQAPAAETRQEVYSSGAMDDRYDEEVRRLTEVLATVVRIAGRTRQSLERELGLSSGYLSKILSGTVDLRARHVFAIAEAAGIDPASFFSLAYPPHEPEGDVKRLIANARAALGQRPNAEELADADFDDRVRHALARLLGLEEPPPK